VAACNGYTNVIRFLVNQPKVDLNVKDNEGNTPLHLAVYFNGTLPGRNRAVPRSFALAGSSYTKKL
jgi:ankyrin repeat protein